MKANDEHDGRRDSRRFPLLGQLSAAAVKTSSGRGRTQLILAAAGGVIYSSGFGLGVQRLSRRRFALQGAIFPGRRTYSS